MDSGRFQVSTPPPPPPPPSLFHSPSPPPPSSSLVLLSLFSLEQITTIKPGSAAEKGGQLRELD
eukprot:579217-Hanusia_phi.AAC.1